VGRRHRDQVLIAALRGKLDLFPRQEHPSAREIHQASCVVDVHVREDHREVIGIDACGQLAIASLAEAGAGIAPLPDYVARPLVERGALVRILIRTEVARILIQAVYPSRRHLPRRVQVVIDALVARALTSAAAAR
jgi:DNA-binding transcriptional LysR family regulator